MNPHNFKPNTQPFVRRQQYPGQPYSPFQNNTYLQRRNLNNFISGNHLPKLGIEPIGKPQII
jgi:hypothetical protein